MFGQMRGSRRRRYGSDNLPSPVSRSEKRGFTIVFAVLIVLAGILLSDFAALKTLSSDGLVINKAYLPPHRGHTSTGATFLRPEKWQLKFNIQGQSVEFQVSKEFFEQINAGDVLKATYTKSRIFQEIEIVSVKK